jgi:hypothetical protein
MSNGKQMSNFEKLHHIAPKFIANRCIISTMSINLTSSCLPDATVLDRPIKERRKLANIFLDEHPQEPVTAVCRLYNIDHDAIYKHRKRSRRHPQGGHNAILSPAQEGAILQYIQDSYDAGYPATKRMVYSAITCLRKADNKPPPSTRWFTPTRPT